jgi:hypothetical protein
MSMARGALRVLVAAGLAVEAWVHWDLAPSLDTLVGKGSPRISMGDLFRLEAGIAVVAALLVLVLPRMWVAVVALLVAAGGLAAVLLYAYVDVGAIGPLPNMNDSTWPTEKVVSAVSQGVAALAALAWLARLDRRPRSDAVPGGHQQDAPTEGADRWT